MIIIIFSSTWLKIFNNSTTRITDISQARDSIELDRTLTLQAIFTFGFCKFF